MLYGVIIECTSTQRIGKNPRINLVCTLSVSINRILIQIQIIDTKYQYTRMLNQYLKGEMHSFYIASMLSLTCLANPLNNVRHMYLNCLPFT